jgi:hypothetical protein
LHGGSPQLAGPPLNQVDSEGNPTDQATAMPAGHRTAILLVLLTPDFVCSITEGQLRYQSLSGEVRAALFNSCNSKNAMFPHSIDTVFSSEHGFAFLDNVKAASTTVRQKLTKILNASWTIPGTKHVPPSRRRYKSTHYKLEQFAQVFVFAIVRDPVKKFESGVRQARSVAAYDKLKYLTMDEILDQQIEQGHLWVNEHLQPSTWRLGGWAGKGGEVKNSRAVPLDFIGSVENFDVDFETIVSRLKHVTDEEVQRLVAHEVKNAKNSSVSADVDVLTATARSQLSPAAIQRMCKSELYCDEWRCTGYPSPC